MIWHDRNMIVSWSAFPVIDLLSWIWLTPPPDSDLWSVILELRPAPVAAFPPYLIFRNQILVLYLYVKLIFINGFVFNSDVCVSVFHSSMLITKAKFSVSRDVYAALNATSGSLRVLIPVTLNVSDNIFLRLSNLFWKSQTAFSNWFLKFST